MQTSDSRAPSSGKVVGLKDVGVVVQWFWAIAVLPHLHVIAAVAESKLVLEE